jgi:hypothetical protein
MLTDCLDIETELLMDAPEGKPATENASTPALAHLFHLPTLLGLFLPPLNLIRPFGLRNIHL